MFTLARATLAVFALLHAPAALGRGDATPTPAAPPPTSPWHLAIGAGTDFPISVGGRLELEASRLRLSSSLGILPGPYVDVINETVVAFGGYDEATADVVKEALSSSLIWRTHLGVRVWRGLYVEAGYGLVTLGGDAAGAELFGAVTGQPVPPGTGDRPFDIRSTLHMADVEIGYDFAVSQALRLRVAIGGAFTFAASTRITPESEAPAQVESFAREAEAYLDDIYTSYVFTPVLSVSAAYRLF
jgi:hypothetical protein